MSEIREVPSLEFGYVPTYFNSRSFALPPGKRYLYTPIQYLPDSYFLGKGPTQLWVNPDSDTSISPLLTLERRGTIISSNQLKDGLTDAIGRKLNKSFLECTEADFRQLATNFCRRKKGFKIITDQSPEVYGTDVQYGRIAGTKGYDWWDQYFAAANSEFTGSIYDYYGSYDSVMSTRSRSSDFDKGAMANERAAYTNDAAALTYAKSAAPFGSTFFTHEMWRYRSCIIQAYYDGVYPMGKRLLNLLSDLWITERAKRGAGAPAECRTMLFAWPQKTAFNGHGTVYQVAVEGGNYFANGFTSYPAKFQTALSFLGLCLVPDINLWEDGVRRGMNKGRLYPEEKPNAKGEGALIHYDGSLNLPREGANNEYFEGKNPGFMPVPHGYHDAWHIGAEWFSEAVAKTNGVYTFADYRFSDAAPWQTNQNGAYLLDTYLNDGVISVVFGATGPTPYEFIVDTGNPSGSYRTVQRKIGSRIVTHELCGQTPYLMTH